MRRPLAGRASQCDHTPGAGEEAIVPWLFPVQSASIGHPEQDIADSFASLHGAEPSLAGGPHCRPRGGGRPPYFFLIAALPAVSSTARKSERDTPISRHR